MVKLNTVLEIKRDHPKTGKGDHQKIKCTMSVYTCLSIYMITSVPCRLFVCLYVAGCLGVRRGVPVDLHVTMEGPGCTGGRVRGGATSPRTKNSRGPGARQIQNSA